ncbi:MAG: diguanylate cyclase [bacterium]|nr:diguanylate cyclase [bacterium]
MEARIKFKNVVISIIIFSISILSIRLFEHLYDTTKIRCEKCIFIKKVKTTGRDLEIPFLMEASGSHIFWFNFERPKCDTPALFIPLIDGNYLEVYLNGHLIGVSGNPISRNSLRWNKPELFVIPGSFLKDGFNELRILVKAENTLGILSPIFMGDLRFVKGRYILLGFLNQVLNQFYLAMFLVLGFFIVLIPFLIELRLHRALLGISLIFFAIYLIDYTFVPYLPIYYAVYKKIIIASLYLSLALYGLAFVYEFGYRGVHRKIALALLVVNIGLILVLLSVPNDSVLVRRTYLKMNVTIYVSMALIVSVFLREIIRSARPEKLLLINLNAIIFLLPHVFNDVYVLVNNLPKPLLTQYALPIFVFANTSYIVNDFITLYRKLILEKRRAEFLEKESMRDPLTGALNRRFLNKIKEIIPGMYSISLIDLDNFKDFNDHFGHVIGDCVLRRITSILFSMLRKDDYVIRYGGDEFLLLLYKTSRVEAEKILEKIKHKLVENKIECDDQDFYVSFSYGIASADEAHTFEEMLKIADSRLYEAKSLKSGV